MHAYNQYLNTHMLFLCHLFRTGYCLDFTEKQQEGEGEGVDARSMVRTRIAGPPCDPVFCTIVKTTALLTAPPLSLPTT